MKNDGHKTLWILGLGAIGVAILYKLAKGSSAIVSDVEDEAGSLLDSGEGEDTSAPPPAAEGLAVYNQSTYAPGSQQAINLFTAAAKYAGFPEEWGSADGLHQILSHESAGWVGRPNYQFGDSAKTSNAADWPMIWQAIQNGTWRDFLAEPWKSGPQGQQSSATGLGQLTMSNIKTGRFYPSGLKGIGNALEEAIGMLRYIKERYGDPTNAWAKYGVGHEGY